MKEGISRKGRLSAGDEQAPMQQIPVALSAQLRKLLDTSAQASSLSLAEEIRRRLEWSFLADVDTRTSQAEALRVKLVWENYGTTK